MKYEINEDTLAIIPINKEQTKIIEKDNEYIINEKAYDVMEYSCEYFGSSLEGRLNGAKNILGSIYKIPIIVEESREIIFFPTTSPQLETNIWISLKNIKKYEKSDKTTIIYFDNDKKVVVSTPYLSINNQILRATRLGSVFKHRKDIKKRR